MAKLKDEDFDIEICLVKLDDYEWIYYEIYINIQGKPVLNRQALWDKGDDKEQIQCSIRTEDYQKDGLLKFIRTILTTNEPDYFEPTEPGFLLAIYPGISFPFSKKDISRIVGIWNHSDEILKNNNQDKGINEYTIILLVDPINFENVDASGYTGPAMVMTICRKDLQQFLMELQAEYDELITDWNKKGRVKKTF